MATIYQEIDVDLDDFDTNDLLEEIEKRDITFAGDNKLLIQKMYNAQQLGQDIQPLLNELYWNTIGRISQ